MLLDIAKNHALIPYNADSPQIFPYIGAYFFITSILFVVGPDSIFPKELKTRIRFVYFPIYRAGWQFMLKVWGRMLIWFAGAAIGFLLLYPLR